MKKIISILTIALLAASVFAVSYKNNTFQKLADEYTKKAERDKRRFLEQQAEFKKNGFYTQTKNSTLSSKKTQKTQSQKKRSQKKSTSPKKSSAKK